MRILLKSALFLILGLIVTCKSESSQNYETTNEIDLPSTEQADSIASVFVEQEKVLEKTIPTELKKEKQVVREEKKNNSIFKNEGCCSNEPPPALCCCEPVWAKYLELFKSGDAEKLSKVRSEDPILNDCYKKIPSFKKKVDEMEMTSEEYR